MIKLIAIDLDGTLLDEQKQIQPLQKQALQAAEAQGVKIVLCTGRNLPGVIPVYEQLGLKENGYVIVNNGCAIHQTHDWGLIDWVQLTKKDMLYLYALQENTDVDITLFDETHYFCVSPTPNEWVQRDAKFVYSTVTPITLEEAISGEHTMFKAMFVGSQEAVDHFESTLPHNILDLYNGVRSQDVIYEAMPLSADKAQGLARLAKHLGIEQQDILAIGDGNNDIEMLQYAGVGVAMGNATVGAKAAANDVTDTNENDGLAKAVQKYVLQDSFSENV